MKLTINKKIILLFTGVTFFTACKVDTLNDPNNPSSSGIVINATLGELQNRDHYAQCQQRINRCFHNAEARFFRSYQQ